MVGAKEIKARIKGVKNIQQITRAMQMVAVAKLKKFQAKATSSRPYEYTLQEIIKNISKGIDPSSIESAFFKSKKVANRIHFVIFTADRGLCGGYNTNIIRFAHNIIKEKNNKEVTISVLGKKGAQYFKKQGYKIENYYEQNIKDVSVNTADDIASDLVYGFENGSYEEVHICFTRFNTPVKSDPVSLMLLPVSLSDNIGEDGNKTNRGNATDITILEPTPERLLDNILPLYFKVQIYKAMIESITSEFAARMVAMKTATDNADEMLEKLILNYNRARQSAITTSILEVASGAEALKEK